MRIGIEAQRAYRTKKHGMDIYALQLIRTLQQIDITNEYFIFVKPGDDPCLKETKNFKIVEVKGLTYADWEQYALPKAAKKYKLDVLHCTSNTAPLITDIPLVVTLHDIIYLNNSFNGGTMYQRLGHFYRKWNVPSIFKKATKVLTVSNFEKQTINNYFGDDNKISVIYNGVDGKFKQSHPLLLREQVMRKYKLPLDYLFFLGNTAPKKNMHTVLDAYGKYHDSAVCPLPLVIAESSEEEVKQMLNKIGRKDLFKSLHLTGYLPHHLLPVVYSQAKLFLYPSLRESFGIPIIEAMACGTPVITSNTSSMPEVAGNAAYLVSPENACEISQAITKILADKPLASKMVKEGLSRANEFTWMNVALDTLNTYRLKTNRIAA